MASQDTSKRALTTYSDAVELGSSQVVGTIGNIIGEDQPAPKSDGRENRRLVSSTNSDDGSEDHHDKVNRYPTVGGIAQTITTVLVSAMFAMLIVLIGISSATFHEADTLPTTSSVKVAYSSLGLPGYEGYSWEDVKAAAKGQSVNFYAYDASAYTTWITTWLAPNLLENFDVTLHFHGITDTGDAVDQIIQQSNKWGNNNGTIDLLWINGENFAKLKNNGYAYGPWSNKVPNAVNYDFQADTIKYDFGLPTNGFEMPYNEAQVIFCYDSSYLNVSSIQDIGLLLTWIQNNPGKFTYAAPRYLDSTGEADHDYTGSAFIRHIFYSIASPYTQFFGDYNDDLYKQYAPLFYKTLRDLEPYLFDASTVFNSKVSGKYYPQNQEMVDQLFGQGHIEVTLSYDVGHATNMVSAKSWPSTSMGTVLTSGTIANTNFVLIPANSANKLAAVVAGNYIASAQAMFSRAQPEVIGSLQAYDPTCDNFLDGWNDAFEYIDRDPATPSTSDLSKYRLSELSAAYINQIEQDWYTCVLTYVAGNSPSYCG